MAPVTLLLVDEHAVVRSGLRMLLESHADIEVLGEAGTGAEALEKIASLHPKVVIVDVRLPDMDGIETTRRVKTVAPETVVLVLTRREDDRFLFGMLQAGATGYVPKRADPDELVAAIRSLGCGSTYVHPAFSGQLVKSYLQHAPPGYDPEAGSALTPRERQVLILIAEGLTNREIPDDLGISPRTVDRHCQNITRKLELAGRIDLVKYAIKEGIVELDE